MKVIRLNVKRGIALRWVVIIPKHITSKGEYEPYLAHEMEHVRQQKECGFIKFAWYYYTNKEYRKLVEQTAYRVQMESWLIHNYVTRSYSVREVETILKGALHKRFDSDLLDPVYRGAFTQTDVDNLVHLVAYSWSTLNWKENL